MQNDLSTVSLSLFLAYRHTLYSHIPNVVFKSNHVSVSRQLIVKIIVVVVVVHSREMSK